MMARPPRPSLAQRLRIHREAFLLAQELGCTPKDAEAELARRKARADWSATMARLAQRKRNGPEILPGTGEPKAWPLGHSGTSEAGGGAQAEVTTETEPARPWWQRD
jgi:hypothetical protein